MNTEFKIANDSQFLMDVEPKVTINIGILGNDVPITVDFTDIDVDQHEQVLNVLLAILRL